MPLGAIDHHKYQFGGRHRMLSNSEEWYQSIKCVQGSEWAATVGDEILCKPEDGILESICVGAVKRAYGAGHVLIRKSDGSLRALKASQVKSVKKRAESRSETEVDAMVDAYAIAEKVSRALQTRDACSPTVRRVVSLNVVACREPCRVLRRNVRPRDRRERSSRRSLKYL